MWLMTTIGFYSVVEKPKGTICIRSRRKLDLKKLTKLFDGCSQIIKTERADYRYRVFMSKEGFEKEFPKLSKLVTYDNFKNAVKKVNSPRELLYHKVWALLLQIETEGENYYTPTVQPQDLVNEVYDDVTGQKL